MEQAGLKPSMTAKIGDQKLDLNITETDADPTKIMASVSLFFSFLVFYRSIYALHRWSSTEILFRP